MKRLLSIIMVAAMLFTVAAVPVQAAVRPDFPMNVRIFVSEDEIEEVADLGNQGFDWVYQSGVQEENGKSFLSFFIWSQEELDYLDENGYEFEITHKNSDVADEPAEIASVTENTENSAEHYVVDAEDGYIVGITGHNTTPIQQRPLNWNVMFDPTGVSFNEVYGFPNRKGYRSVEEYYGEMFYLAKEYPHLAKIYQIGASWYNPIYVLEICDAPGVEDGRAEWLSLAAQHAREWPANELVMNNAWWLVTQYDKYLKGDQTVEPGIIEVMETIRTWSLPMYGVDGTWYDQSNGASGAGSNRSNRRPGPDYVTSYNEVLKPYAYGADGVETGRFYYGAGQSTNSNTAYNFPVDLNRNFAYRWGSSDGSSNQTGNQGGSTTRGPTPLSEPENQTLASLVARRMIGSDYSGHTYGGLVIYPWDNKKGLAVTPNMNFEELGRQIATYNNYNDYHERVIYSQSGEGQGFMFGSWRSLGFTYEMGYNYQSAMQDNFVPLYNGHTSYWKVAVASYNDKNPHITTRYTQPGGALVAPAGTSVIPLHYRNLDSSGNPVPGSGQISEELTAPVAVMMPECVTNQYNVNNCLKDVYGNDTEECEYHNNFQTTYTTADLLATVERFNQMLAEDPDFVKDKILLCYRTVNPTSATNLILAAQEAGAKAVILAQCGTGNNANSAHTMTDSQLVFTNNTSITIPVALTPRPFARDIHNHVRADANITLTLKPEFIPWNTQMMEWERNCYSFLELAKFSRDYSGHIIGSVTDGNGNAVEGAKLDLSLNVYAPILREGVRDVFWWNLDDYNATTNPNGISSSSRNNFGALVKMYTHPLNGDKFVVREFTHTSYIDKFKADGSFDWSVLPSTQPDTYAYEGLRQPPNPTTAGGNGARGILGGFELDSPDDPRNGTLLFPNNGYTVTASAPGSYIDSKKVVVNDYKSVVKNVNFVVRPALKTDTDLSTEALAKVDPNEDFTIRFSTYDKNGNPSDFSNVNVRINGTVVAVQGGSSENSASISSSSVGQYTATFKFADAGVANPAEAVIVIDFDGGAKTPLIAGNVEAYSEVNTNVVKLTTDANLVNAGDEVSLKASFLSEVKTNVAALYFDYDYEDYDFKEFIPANGVQVIKEPEVNNGKVKVFLMKQDNSYGFTDLGELVLTAKEDKVFDIGFGAVSVYTDYVIVNEGAKEAKWASASTSFTTGTPQSQNPSIPAGSYDLIDLSNVIDWFGFNNRDTAEWSSKYTFWDFNNNGSIDVSDIAYVAMKVVILD